MGRKDEAGAHYARAVELTPRGTLGTAAVWAAAYYRRTGQLDKADQVMLDHLELIEEILRKNQDSGRARVQLASAYGSLGDMKRMKEEAARILREFSDQGLVVAELAIGAGIVGDRSEFVRLMRNALQNGIVARLVLNSRAFYGDPNIEQWPGAQELLVEHSAAVKRLEALY